LGPRAHAWNAADARHVDDRSRSPSRQFFTQRHDLLGAEMVGFGGVDDVKFRGVVLPGDRLVVMVRLIKARRNRMIVAQFQGVVGDQIVCEGELKGIPIPIEYVTSQLAKFKAAQ